MLTLLKIIKILFPLLKEYALSNVRSKSEQKSILFALAIILSFIVLTFEIQYGVEQATRNLTIHEGIISQYNQLAKTNNELRVSEAKAKRTAEFFEEKYNALRGVSVSGIETGENVEYKYDEESKHMVPTDP